MRPPIMKVKSESASAIKEKKKKLKGGMKDGVQPSAGSSSGSRTGGGIIFNTGRGQHILFNPLVVNAIVERAAIRPSDTVLEIGPGTGNLTVKLLAVAKQVIAFEIDPRMISELQKRVQGTPYASKLKVIKGDAIKNPFPFFNVCVANVPYAISSPLIFKLLNHRPFFRCALLMLQREFAMRMVAKPPSTLWGRLAINCQLLSKVDHIMKVSAKSFKPPPKVESSVIRLEQRNPPPPIDIREWDEMIKIAFMRKHKLLRGLFVAKTNLKALHAIHCSYSKMNDKPALTLAEFKEIVIKVLDHTPVGQTEPFAKRRGCELQLDDLMLLMARFLEAGVRFR